MRDLEAMWKAATPRRSQGEEQEKPTPAEQIAASVASGKAWQCAYCGYAEWTNASDWPVRKERHEAECDMRPKAPVEIPGAPATEKRCYYCAALVDLSGVSHESTCPAYRADAICACGHTANVHTFLTNLSYVGCRVCSCEKFRGSADAPAQEKVDG